MIKGWRLNPDLVERRERKDRERAERIMRAIRLEIAHKQALSDMEASIRRLEGPLVKFVC
jgi:hypothetical protein